MGYFGATKFVDFVNERYEELNGDGAKTSSAPPAPTFAPTPAGNVLANKMWRERAAEREAERASSWDEEDSELTLRSAPEIFFGGLENLAKDPKGWLFGSPSPLYSNARAVADAPTTPTATAAPPPVAATPAPAEAAPAVSDFRSDFLSSATPPRPVSPPVPLDDAPPEVPPAETAAPPAPRAPETAAAASGRVVPTGSAGYLKRKKRRAERAQREEQPDAERVAPSTPEEVEAARRGEYDFYPGKE